MQCADTDIVNTPLEPLRPTHVHPFFCKQNLLPFIQSRWQPRTYFFNHYNIFFLMNLHSPSKSNANSIQIPGFILTCLSFTIDHFHTCVLCKKCSLNYFPFLIIGLVFSDSVVFYGDCKKVYHPDRNSRHTQTQGHSYTVVPALA